MPCMAGAVHTQRLIRAQSGQTALLGESKDYKNRTEITWALIFPQARYLKFNSHAAQADFVHLLTRDVIFQQEKKKKIVCTKI